jgi:NAD+ synthetase
MKRNYESIFNQLVDDTMDYLQKNNLNTMVLGISGGIDSTVVSCICSEVVERLKTINPITFIGRSLPIKNGKDEFSTSELVGNAFCTDFKVVNLKHSYTAFLSNLTLESGDEIVDNDDQVQMAETAAYLQNKIANGNIQARLRMIYLYNLASIHNGIVMDTDNLTEHNLGFWTINGDVGDLNPIGDLWKTEVYELAKFCLERYKKLQEAVDDSEKKYCLKIEALEKSIALAPTDGLGITSTDLDQIGARSYYEVDYILKSFLGIDTSDMEDPHSEKEVFDKVIARHLGSEHKRKARPIVVHIEEQ